MTCSKVFFLDTEDLKWSSETRHLDTASNNLSDIARGFFNNFYSTKIPQKTLFIRKNGPLSIHVFVKNIDGNLMADNTATSNNIQI